MDQGLNQLQAKRRFLDTGAAADYLGLSPRTLQKQRVYGGGPRFRKFGRRVLYARDDLDLWADERTHRNGQLDRGAARCAGV